MKKVKSFFPFSSNKQTYIIANFTFLLYNSKYIWDKGEIKMKYTFNDKDQLVSFICTEIITTAEATDILDCSRQYLDELVSKGKITPIKTINRVRLYWRNDIVNLLEKRHSS